jgi:16S rRNA (cytidine1402-2'-O)-methyltransferase
MTPTTGTLFVVATPIGNLEDLTFRALRTLREVDLIAAEDTRRTAKLLARYEVRKRLVSLREHNEARETPRLLAELEAGRSIALVSDAGTPTIADPGTRLIAAAHDRHVHVVPIPGPSAVAAALSVSGFTADQFVFMGFPPAAGAVRARWFQQLADETRTVVFFEAPHRVRRTLHEVLEYVKRPIITARELTKVHESLVIQPTNNDIIQIQPIGEFVIVVDKPHSDASQAADDKAINDVFGYMTQTEHIERDSAIRIISRCLRLEHAVVKKAVKRAGIEAKQALP